MLSARDDAQSVRSRVFIAAVCVT